ncbi:MAG: pyridoxal-phosphate dependent enzyme [Alphaproteobacteria bacterium]|jgi:cystathionine beta-synthase|nr:pyridoxal-phosphate dependent enzyme [Alphaproteobacteria bacterium]MDP6515317.1 pyridoxal-phosphate dependent enzyme [Alphaproteobacteria bacterium]
MAPFGNVLDMIGDTPMVALGSFETGPCGLFVKLENQNPGGSIKDRTALAMVDAAERAGDLRPGGRLIEATAGNTGLGLALVASQKGYRLTVVVPDKMSQEKIFHLRAMGAEVVMTRSDVGKGHPDYYHDTAIRLAEKDENACFVNQFSNPANVLAHEEGTGPEIWRQMEHDVDAVVCGVGTGGTLTGLGRFFARTAPEVEMVLADPEGSVLVDYLRTGAIGKAGSWLVEGIGEDFVPDICDLSLVGRGFTIPDREAFAVARDLLGREGILAGSSSGTLIAAALRYCRAQTERKRVVTFVCDSGNKYLSKMFNDYWMLDHGFLDRPRHGDLRDLISRPHAEHAAVVLAPDDTLLTAYGRMKLYDISQLPVLGDESVMGIIDESDLLLAVYGRERAFGDQVRDHMVRDLTILDPGAPIEALLPIFARNQVAVIEDDGRFLGLITKIDLLNHLRRKVVPGL